MAQILDMTLFFNNTSTSLQLKDLFYSVHVLAFSYFTLYEFFCKYTEIFQFFNANLPPPRGIVQYFVG